MVYLDILGFFGIIVGGIGFVAYAKYHKRILFVISLTILIIYSLLRPIYPLTFVLLLLTIVYLIVIYKYNPKNLIIKLEEIDLRDKEFIDFINTYERDIYNFSPFFQKHKDQKCFFVKKGTNIVGIFIYTISGDELTVEVDYIKPIYRDLGVGNYIYNQNPGYFKKMGVNKIISKSFHKGYSRSLKKLGFEEKNIDHQLFYMKSLD